jgi:hypothetical protein
MVQLRAGNQVSEDASDFVKKNDLGPQAIHKMVLNVKNFFEDVVFFFINLSWVKRLSE